MLKMGMWVSLCLLFLTYISLKKSFDNSITYFWKVIFTLHYSPLPFLLNPSYLHLYQCVYDPLKLVGIACMKMGEVSYWRMGKWPTEKNSPSASSHQEALRLCKPLPLFLFLRNRVSLSFPGWPQTH